MEKMAGRYGFQAEEECRGELKNYIQQIRHRKNFGNAREVRKLLETAIEEYGLRTGGADGTDKTNSEAGAGERRITAADLRKAAEYLLQEEKTAARFGFAGGA